MLTSSSPPPKRSRSSRNRCGPPGKSSTSNGAASISPSTAGAAITGLSNPRPRLPARPSLSDEQQAMVRHLTSSGNAVDVVVGRAGSGKTFALDAIRDAYETAGHRVIGTALSARAAKELQSGSGIPSQTIASLQSALSTGRARLDDKTAVVIDEAAMVGTRHLAALLADANRAGAKVIAVGDHRQLPEIEAGGLFRALADRLDTVTLVANLRQTDPVERAALVDLRHGRVDQALGRLARHGKITLADNGEALRDQLVADWAGHRDDGKHVVMAALRRADIADLNARAHTQLRNAGRLGPAVLTVDDVNFHVGDVVLAHRNRYDLGILNGETAKVTGASARHLHLKVDGQRPKLAVPLEYIADGHLTHGYATTVHKAQGITCDIALLLGGDGLFQELGYTGLSRGRDRNQLYVVANRELMTSADRAPDPVAHIRSALAVPHAQTAAVDLLSTLTKAKGR